MKWLSFCLPSPKKGFLSHQNWLAVVAGFKYLMKYIKQFMQDAPKNPNNNHLYLNGYKP